MPRPSLTICSIRYRCLIYLMRCVCLIICYTFTSPRQFRLFCDVNSTSYGPCPLNDGRGFDRPRRRIFSGIHRRCHRDKACPPSLVKKRRVFLAATAYGELSQFLFLYIKCSAFQVEPFVAYTTCDLGSCVATQTLWLFDISVSAVWQVSVTHTFFPFSLSTSKHIFYPIDWLAYIKPLSSWQNFIWIFSTFPVSFKKQLSATSTLDTLCARRS